MNPVVIPLRAPLWKGVVSVAVLIGLAAVAGQEAVTIRNGIVIEDLIRIDHTDTVLLLTRIAILFGLAAIVAIGSLVVTVVKGSGRIEIADGALILPRAFHLGHRAIVLGSIHALVLKPANKATMLEIQHTRGKVTVDGSWLPAGQDLKALRAKIGAAAQRSRLTAERATTAVGRSGGPTPVRSAFGQRAPAEHSVSA